MNLIYTDNNRRDLGIITPITGDFAFGVSENDFQFDCDIYEPMLTEGAFIYYENTEFGGIIDQIGSNSNNNTIRYKGRTWHGLLDSKIVEPPKNKDYLVLNGEANEVIQALLEVCQLTSIFQASTSTSEFNVNNYEVPRYWGLYQVLNHMLNLIGARLELTYNGQVILAAVPLVDYSQKEEWNTQQMKLYIEKNYKPTNHLICLGTGELAQRHVIHLYTDSNGGVMPYATVDKPYKDSQYILDNRNQQLFGADDVSKVYEYTGAQDIESYEVLNTKPSNWETSYYNYYIQVDEEQKSYEKIEQEFGDVYTALAEEPSDWGYNTYYYKDGSNYKAITESMMTKTPQYEVIDHKPKDWDTNYSNYYYYWTDGVTSEYKKIPGVKYNTYKKQTQKPSDWSTNKGNYYIKKVTRKYVYEFKRRQNGTWNKYIKELNYKVKEYKKPDATCTFIRSYVAKTEYISISTLIKNKEAKESDFKNWKQSSYQPFYTQYSNDKAPSFSDYTVRTMQIVMTPPAFDSRTWYKKEYNEIVPIFASGVYYQLFVDHYKDLVTNALDDLAKEWNTDDIDIKFSADDTEYYIGDIIGATDAYMNMTVTARISKKILRVNKKTVTIQYTVK